MNLGATRPKPLTSPPFRATFNGYGGWGDVRVVVTLECTQCKRRNYATTKNKQKHPERLELRKYCKYCRTHTLHRETK